MVRLLMHTATSYRMTIGAIFSGLAALACYRIFEGVRILLLYYFDRHQRKRPTFSFCVCSFQFSLLSLSCRLALKSRLYCVVYSDRQGFSPIYVGLVRNEHFHANQSSLSIHPPSSRSRGILWTLQYWGNQAICPMGACRSCMFAHLVVHSIFNNTLFFLNALAWFVVFQLLIDLSMGILL